MFLRDSLISWKAKKQSTISRSSVGVEYRAMAATTYEIVWLRQVLRDFGVVSSSPTFFFVIQTTLYITSNPIFHERIKYIEIDYYFIRDNVVNGWIKLIHICSHDQFD